MSIEKSWLWNVKTTDAEAKKILNNPEDPRFYLYAAKRLATANLPREVFRDYLRREDFLMYWPAIKRQMRKDSRNHERVIFWQGAYEHLIKELKVKGTPFVRPKAEVRIDPEQQRIGEALKELRRAKKMTQAELAKRTGLTQQHIAKIEKGITRPRPETRKAIDKALGTFAYEYKADQAAGASGRVAEPGFPGGGSSDFDRHAPSTIRHPDVLTWFTSDPGLRTESK